LKERILALLKTTKPLQIDLPTHFELDLSKHKSCNHTFQVGEK